LRSGDADETDVLPSVSQRREKPGGWEAMESMVTSWGWWGRAAPAWRRGGDGEGNLPGAARALALTYLLRYRSVCDDDVYPHESIDHHVMYSWRNVRSG
jgi:hypothetical protein